MKKIKVLFIKPPIPYHLNPKEQQPLGVLYVASYVRSMGYEINLIDLSDKKINEAINFISRADVYAFTSSFLDLCTCHKLAKEIKIKFNNSKIIIGGNGPTSSPECINPKIFNSMIIGEGEKAMLTFLNDVYSNHKLKRRYSEPFLLENELNKLPFPARDLLDCQGGKIFNFGDEYIEGQSTGIITSRGCPFNCSFCASESMWHRKVRFRSVNSVVAEIKEIINKFGIYKIKFQDDTFTLSEKRVIDICKEIENLNKQYNKKLVWRCYGGRVNLVTEKMLRAMKKAGCKEVDFGIESGDQNILDLMRKNITVKQSINTIKLARKVGIDSRSFMMVGLPGTTEKTADRDIEFIKKAKPDAINLAIYTPYPGSDIWKQPEKYNIKILNKPKDYTELEKFNKYNMHILSNDPNRTTKSIIKIKGLSAQKLEKIKQKIIDYVINHRLFHYVKSN
ncbi:MAG: radical SAM protein [Patescibacteria group bacterium]